MDFTIDRLDFVGGKIQCVNCEAELDPEYDQVKWTRNAHGLPLMAAVTCPKDGAITTFKFSTGGPAAQ